MKSNVIVVSGYGWTGSSAVIDLLKEYRGLVTSRDDEFRLYKDPGGIIDLENLLTRSWSVLNANFHCQEFLRLSRRFSKNRSKFSQHNYEYDKRFGISLERMCSDFIDHVTVGTWKGYSFLYDRKYSGARFFWTKLLRRVGILDQNNSDVRFIPHGCQIGNAILEFSRSLCEEMSENENKRIVLNQALPACNPAEYHRFFDDAKTIVVNRDPRDIYTYAKSFTWLPENRELFVAWYQDQMDMASKQEELEGDQVLRINFEDLILQYDYTKSLIESFLGLNPDDHIRPGSHLKPDVSLKNIGLWKKNASMGDIDFIKKELEKYVYNR